MPKAPRALYFTDENALGLGKLLLRSGRDDVLFPGHPGLPQVPLGTPDLDWMPVVAHRKLIVITRDKRIRTRPAELAATPNLESVPCGSGPRRTSARINNWSCSCATKTGCGERSSNAVPDRGHWR
ncbi:hypothetical protein [Sporichthya sp.]|uniref:PIN-like domain-containing protein n=1 Tax=Sporichthya sp. TaxID=65475 RepID=UPI0017F60F5F|nr:hypothetical protein [Sporichthya sp.]MBA3741342.1 hypothetical protein [Sporichthya sp.]